MNNNATRNTCRPQLLEDLDKLLRDINPYALSFRTMRETWEAEQTAAAAENPPRAPQNVTMYFIGDSRDPRRYNLPAGNEVAAVFVGNDGNPPHEIDFVIYDRNPYRRTNLQRMNSANRHADPMLYPLLFPHGESGWSMNLPHRDPVGLPPTRK